MTDAQMVYESLLDSGDGWQHVTDNGLIVGVTRGFKTIYGSGEIEVAFAKDGSYLEYIVYVWLEQDVLTGDAYDEICVQLNAMPLGRGIPLLRWTPLIAGGWEGQLHIPGTAEFWEAVPAIHLLNNVLHTSRTLERHARLVMDVLGDCVQKCLADSENAAHLFEHTFKTLCGPLLFRPPAGSA